MLTRRPRVVHAPLGGHPQLRKAQRRVVQRCAPLLISVCNGGGGSGGGGGRAQEEVLKGPVSRAQPHPLGGAPCKARQARAIPPRDTSPLAKPSCTPPHPPHGQAARCKQRQQALPSSQARPGLPLPEAKLALPSPSLQCQSPDMQYHAPPCRTARPPVTGNRVPWRYCRASTKPPRAATCTGASRAAAHLAGLAAPESSRMPTISELPPRTAHVSSAAPAGAGPGAGSAARRAASLWMALSAAQHRQQLQRRAPRRLRL